MDGVKGVDGGIVILASWEYYFIRVYKNILPHPNNCISNAILNSGREGTLDC